MPQERPIEDFRNYLEGLHDAGLVDLDRPLRDFLTSTGLHVDVGEPGGARTTMIWVFPSIWGQQATVPLESIATALDPIRRSVEEMRAELQRALPESGN